MTFSVKTVGETYLGSISIRYSIVIARTIASSGGAIRRNVGVLLLLLLLRGRRPLSLKI